MVNKITKLNNNLMEKTIKSYLNHFELKIKKGFIWKEEIAIYTEDLNDRNALLCFLIGISSIYDNLDFWGLKQKTILKNNKKYKEIIRNRDEDGRILTYSVELMKDVIGEYNTLKEARVMARIVD